MGRPFLISWSYARCSWRQKWTRYKHSEVPQHRHLTCFPPHPTVSVITRRVYIHWPSFLSSTSPAPITPSWILVFQQKIPHSKNSAFVNESREPKILLVSAFFPLKQSKHPQKDYADWLSRFIGSITTPIYFYTTPSFAAAILAQRGPHPIRVNTSFTSPFDIPPHFRASRMPTRIYIHLIEKPFDTVQNYMQSGMPNHGCLIELCSSQYRKEMNMISLSGMMQVVLGVSIITQNGLTPSAWRTYGRLAFHVWKPQETWRQESQTCCFSR